MALDQSALLGLVESLRAGDESMMMRRMLTIMLEQLIEAEACVPQLRVDLVGGSGV
jgi:hypothetical protein